MNNLELLNQIEGYAEKATEKAGEYSGFLGEAKHFIVETFGPNGLIAAYIVLAAIILLLIMKLTKVTFSALKYLVIPAVGLAFLASLFLPMSFASALPVTVTVCSLFMLFKG